MVRKIPHYFTQDFWTQIYFKNPDISKSIVGLVEAFSAYSFAQNNFEVSNIIERVVDFSVVYFSEDKWLKLINELMVTSDPKLRRVLKDKLRILELRRKSSTKYMKEFACNSSTMRELFKISLQVLSQFLEHKSNWKESASISKISQNCNIFGRRVTTRKSALVDTNSTHNSSSKLEILSSAQKNRAEYLYQKTKRVLNL